MNNKNYGVAIEYYLKSIYLSDYLMAYQNLGRLYLGLNRFEDAEMILTRGIKIYPADKELNDLQEVLNSL